MAGGLTIEQMEFLASKGLTFADAIEFAKMGAKPRSKGAERIARWRAKKKGVTTDDTPESVTSNVTCNALPPPIEDHTPPVSSDEETIPPARKSKQALPAKPAGVKDQTWADFLDLRKRKRAPLTETALAEITREAGKAGWAMEAALTKCLARGWQGFEADWVTNAKPSPPAANDLVAGILGRQPNHA